METETKQPPLQKEWEEHKRLRDEGEKLRVEGSILWYDAVRRYYGKDVKVTWRKWHKDNDMTCHINSDVYV